MPKHAFRNQNQKKALTNRERIGLTGQGYQKGSRRNLFARTDLAGANRFSLFCPVCGGLLAAVTHTSYLYYSLPLVRHADADVCYLEYHTQAELTHAAGIGINELHYLLLGFIA